MTSTIRAKQIVESPLPSLQIGPYHTVSSALQPLCFEGTLIPWSNFLRSVEHAHTNQNWARSRTSPYANGPHSTEADRVHTGDEHGLQGRFQQAIGQAFGAVLEAKAINLYFADFKSSGSNYDKIPDVVGLQDMAGITTIKLVGELKTPWVIQHTSTRRFTVYVTCDKRFPSQFGTCRHSVASMGLSVPTTTPSSFDSFSPLVGIGKYGIHLLSPRHRTTSQQSLTPKGLISPSLMYR